MRPVALLVRDIRYSLSIGSQDAADVGKQRVLLIRRKHFLVFVLPAYQQTRRFKAVEFDPDGVGRFAEFLLQSAKISLRFGVQKEPEQQFDAGFVGDEGI